ncbi:MAG: 6-phosphofructokinase [Gammaproteobacteria bacterium]|nr:6-phosphofructokinase [Gammaproteobacteria bacterium]
MSFKINKLLVITSGGDAPGMNAVIRAVVRTAIYEGIEIYGCRMGYQGIVEQEPFLLDSHFVSNCIQRGGTILQSARYEKFKEKTTRDQARAKLAQYNIDAMVVLGGDGSFRGATLLEREGGPRVIGVPCTIDNDIAGTEYTIGFNTARNTAVNAIDKIRDTAFSHNRNFLVEVMGRASGFLAVDVGIAGGAEFILIPEIPLSIDDLAARIAMNKAHNTKLGSIIVVAEADNPGHSFAIAEQLQQRLHEEYKVCVLGHTQRGGTPSVEDRKIGSLMGARAVHALQQGQTQKMLVIKQGQLLLADFPDPTAVARQFSDMELLKINKILCNV